MLCADPELSRGINENNNEFLSSFYEALNSKKKVDVLFIYSMWEFSPRWLDKRWMTERERQRELLFAREEKFLFDFCCWAATPHQRLLRFPRIKYNICCFVLCSTLVLETMKLGRYLSLHSQEDGICRLVVDDYDLKKELKLTRNYESNTSSKVEDFMPLRANGQYEEQIANQ